MVCDLERLYGALANTVPSAKDSEFIFSADTLPQPPASLETDRIVARKLKHAYSGYTQTQVDAIWMQAYQRTYRLLGLLILAKVFHATPGEVHLHLLHPASDICMLVLDYHQGYPMEFVRGYQTRPYQFVYHVMWFEKYEEQEHFLPIFSLTNKENCVINDEWEHRDTLRGAGPTDYGNIIFAQLLLNISTLTAEHDQTVQLQNGGERSWVSIHYGTHISYKHGVVLEGPLGNQAVGRGSVEMKLFFPGSLGWDDIL